MPGEWTEVEGAAEDLRATKPDGRAVLQMPVSRWWLTGRGVRVMTVGVVLAAAVAVIMTAGFQMAMYLLTVQAPSQLTEVPRVSKVALLFFIFALAGPFAAMALWQLCRPRSRQQIMAAEWSLSLTVVWGVFLLYFVFVFYPLPYQSHHIEKVLLAVVLLLLWSVLFVWYPGLLERFLNSRAYAWMKIGIVNLVIFLVVAEVGFRLADPVLARSGLFGDKESPAGMKRHLATSGSIGFTNSHGFRDRERTFAKAPNSVRALALGDSFSYGAGVTYDETFVTILETGLQGAMPGAEVINLGVSGWDPDQESHLLKTYGIRFQPDLVVLNFFVGNDIMRDRTTYREEAMVVAGQNYHVHVLGNRVHDALSPDRWYTYHNVNYLLKVGGNWLRHRRAYTPEGIDVAGIWQPFRTRRDYLKDIDRHSEIYLARDSSLFAYHWAWTQAVLRDMQRFLQGRGVPLLLVLLPAQEQVDPDLQQELLTVLGAQRDQYDFEKPQRLLRQYCEERGIAMVDLLPVFQAHPEPAALYLENDIHWSKQGHSLGAKAILPYLQRHLLHEGTHH